MLTVKPAAGALGAEIGGLDLCAEIPRATVRELRQLLNDYEVLFFREQSLLPGDLRALALEFGPLQGHPAYASLDGFPEVTILESTPERPTRIEAWHSDMTFRLHPPMATLLKSDVVPSKGGDTLWASMTAAYEGLSAPMQDFLAPLYAVHDFSYGFKESLAEPGGRERLADAVSANPPVRHPVIRVHPETDKRLIFVNALFTTHIDGLAAAESRAILDYLYKHVSTVEYTARFQWQANSIALWDNRSTQHKPVNDYFPEHRRMQRITIDGDKPY